MIRREQIIVVFKKKCKNSSAPSKMTWIMQGNKPKRKLRGVKAILRNLASKCSNKKKLPKLVLHSKIMVNQIWLNNRANPQSRNLGKYLKLNLTKIQRSNKNGITSMRA